MAVETSELRSSVSSEKRVKSEQLFFYKEKTVNK